MKRIYELAEEALNIEGVWAYFTDEAAKELTDHAAELAAHLRAHPDLWTPETDESAWVYHGGKVR